MHILHTNGEHPDFIALCQALDATLDAVAGGQDRRADYIPYKQRDDLHDVLIVSFSKLVNLSLPPCSSIKNLATPSSPVMAPTPPWRMPFV